MVESAAPSIQVLPPDVAARIAAGEVIERPVSVVRELLDNAIDAGATRISLEVEDGGVALIRVIDNGRGIPPEQLDLAFERHATSKLRSVSELASVHTLGFRGEALPSIAAAADVEVISRAASEPVGVQAVLSSGKVVRRTGRPAPQGTSFTVRNLFGSLPARRKFLSTAPVEGRQVSVLASHYALAYPGIAFRVSVNGRSVLGTPGDGSLLHAFAAIYGPDAASQMLPVDGCEGGVRVSGLAAPPSIHRGNRSAISVFVNGRWVQSRTLVYGVVEAYHGQLPVGRFPVACLDIAVPEEDVDVNVHPAKAEVRFRDERSVADAMRHAVRAAVGGSSPVVSWISSPPARTQPGLRDRLQSPASATPLALNGPQPVQARLEVPPAASSHEPLTHREVLPMLRVVGQMANTYVIAEGPDGTYILDQHAAHERVRFERVLAARSAGEVAVQRLLDPAILELDAERSATLEAFRTFLEELGLETEPFGERIYLVRAVPVGIGASDVIAETLRLLDDLSADRRVADPFTRAAATIACHSSVRAGMALSTDEMRALLKDLESTESPRTCPHGRPTLILLTTDAIERQFGRR